MGGLSTACLDLQIKTHKFLVYSPWGPSQEESSKHLRLSNLEDKDITKMLKAGGIQTETRKDVKYYINATFNTLNDRFVVKQLTVLLVKILRPLLGQRVKR